MNVTQMDSRIFKVAGHQVLLERFQNDDQWQVAISVFVDEESRYDEWVDCENPKQAREFIKTYPEGRTHEFMARANEWWEKENARLAGVDANA